MTIEEEIASVAINVTAPPSAAWRALQGSEHHREYVRRLSLAISPLLNRVRAEALREAAGALARPSEGAGYEVWAHGGGDWLRARADRIEQNSEGNVT